MDRVSFRRTADDEPIVFVINSNSSAQRTVKMLLKTVGLRTEVYASALEFLARERFDGPSCLLLDIRMPGMSGLELQEALNRADYNIPVIFITRHADIESCVRAMKAGAEDFIKKPFNNQILLDAVNRAITKAKQMISRKSEGSEIQRRIASLTHREYQVFIGTIQGKSNRQMALDSGTVEGTIKAHRGKVMKKMQADSLAALIQMADKIRLSESRICLTTVTGSGATYCREQDKTSPLFRNGASSMPTNSRQKILV